MSAQDPARIAAGMTQDMREVLAMFPLAPDAGLILHENNPLHQALRTERPALIASPFGAAGAWTLTPLGRAVRAALADASADGDVA